MVVLRSLQVAIHSLSAISLSACLVLATSCDRREESPEESGDGDPGGSTFRNALFIRDDVGDLVQAISLFDEAVESEPGNAEYINERGITHRRMGNYEAALADYAAAAALDPSWANPILNRANVQTMQGHLAAARESYDEAIALDPTLAEAYIGRSALALIPESLADGAGLDRAAADCLRAFELDPELAFHAQINLGYVRTQQGRLADAAAAYRHATSADSRAWLAWYELGRTQADLGEFSDAVSSYNRARLHFAPGLGGMAISVHEVTEAEIVENLAVALMQSGRFDEAFQAFAESIELDPELAAAYTNRGSLYVNLGRYDEARTDLTRAAALDPTNADVHYNFGILLGQQEQLEEAITAYDRAIALRPDFSAAHHNRSIDLTTLHRLDDAVASYTALLEVEPGHFGGRMNRSLIYAELGQMQLAIDEMEAGLAAAPANWVGRPQMEAILDAMREHLGAP